MKCNENKKKMKIFRSDFMKGQNTKSIQNPSNFEIIEDILL